MGYFGKIEEKLEAQKLRKKGWSYGRIKQKVSVSKDTISRWCKNIPLTLKQKETLLNNKKWGQRKGSIIAAENKKKIREANTLNINKLARRELKFLTKRDQFIAGIALYAAEGDKADGRGGFANSDPKLIKFMTDWFLEFPKVNKKRLRGALWIHNNLNIPKAEKFWSDLTNIPIKQFHKTYQVAPKLNSRKIRKNIHKFGVFSVRFYESDKQRKILGWILALFGSKM